MRQYYRVMLGDRGQHADDCLKRNYIGLYDVTGDISNELSLEKKEFCRKLVPVFLESEPDRTKDGAKECLGYLYTLAKEIKEGDIVLCPNGKGQYLVGEVMSGYSYHTGKTLPHQRSVNWYSNSVDRAKMSPELQGTTGSPGTTQSITKYTEELERLINSSRIHTRVVFFNIGWMKYYQGIPADESDKIQGGGAFVEENGFGYEIYNFRPDSGKLYGYVQPVTQGRDYAKGQILIERLGAPTDAQSIDGVTAVFVANSPHTDVRRIVGWYENATIFRQRQAPPDGSDRTFKGEEMGFYATTTYGNHFLLDQAIRDHNGITVPTGKNGMGRSNVWYADSKQGHAFVAKVISYIASVGRSEEADDAAFQMLIQTTGEESLPTGPVRRPQRGNVSHQQWQKDPAIARGVLRASNYQCALDSTHKTFVSQSSSENYMEAHHLVPMSQQNCFEMSLDVPGNIVSLCPTCHRLLHFGKLNAKLPGLRQLYATRCEELRMSGIDLSEKAFVKFYGS